MYREAHHHSRDNVGVRTSETSAEGKLDVLRATLLIVSRLRSDGGLGVDRECDGGNAATLSTSSRSGKGAPTGVLGAALRDGSQLLQSCQRRI